MESDRVGDNVKTPYCEISKTVVERLEKRHSGISLTDIRSFLLWTTTMDELPPNWIFIGNKPSIQNVTVVVVKEDEIEELNGLEGMESIPVRKAPIKDIWDQYLLYGIQSVKRDHSSLSTESNDKTETKTETTPIPLNTICLSEEELQTNNYMVVKSKEHREQLQNEGFLFLDSIKVPSDYEFTEDDLIAVDCEMVETKGGRDELAHVSLVSSKGTLYDKYVLPSGEITDYRTAWSGITPSILKNCTNQFSDVQQEVYSLLTTHPTILVGHSLENDLAVLKLVPSNVIDTAVRYIHPTPGYKHSLRHLTVQYLNRSIQGGERGGHDPVEDARAALELALYYSQMGTTLTQSWKEQSKPTANRRTCLLQQISRSNKGKRMVFMGWNDYVMTVSQHNSVGDMMVLKNGKMTITKLRTLGNSSRIPYFTYSFSSEYYFTEIGGKKEGKSSQQPITTSSPSQERLNAKELLEMFKECYKNSLLCLLVMKRTFDESAIGGRLYIYLNAEHPWICLLYLHRNRRYLELLLGNWYYNVSVLF